MKWARANGAPWNAVTCIKAVACSGELTSLLDAAKEGTLWDECRWVFEQEGEVLHPEVLKWAIENGCPGGERFVRFLQEKG